MHPTLHRFPHPLLLLFLAVGATHPAAAQPGDGTTLGPVAEALRARLEASEGLVVGESPMLAHEALPLFYERRVHSAAWVEEGRPASRAAKLRQAIRAARLEGLDPEDYRVTRLEELALEAARPAAPIAALVDFDLLHTDAFLLLAAHLVNGRVNPESFDAEWIAVRREVDLVTLLQDAVADDAVGEALASLRPDHPAYARMVEALALYRTYAAEGGWPTVPPGETLEPGASDPRVLAVALRLHATGDLVAGHEGDLYDEELADAVRRFQGRHGLEPDAKIGPRTIEAMNVSAADRAHQIELNLTRWRWLPQDLGERFVLVNIPSFELWLVEGSDPVFRTRVIVGRSYRRTPVFSDLIRYIVFNPSWEVPPSIAVQDKLPLIRKDPSFLAQQGFRVYSGWGGDERQIDPATVDWSTVTRRSFPYRLRQDPGPLNALGQVKIMFPNRFNVYLHDTPARELFRQSDRDFSSGCIRVQHPLDLATELLRGAPAWDRAAIDRAVASRKTTTVSLPEPVPVHVQYWTSWVDAEGEVQFRRDLYGRDALLDEALHRGRDAAVSGD